jgi:hypothetical protein
MMADVLLQSLSIEYITRFSTSVVNKRDFVTVCFHDAPMYVNSGCFSSWLIP